MSNPSKAKGTQFETSLLELLTSHYKGAGRNPLAGNKDVGDFNLPGEYRFILEAKNRSVMALPAWLKQAATSAKNFHPLAVGVVVHKRKGNAQAQDQYVTMTLGDFLYLVNVATGRRSS